MKKKSLLSEIAKANKKPQNGRRKKQQGERSPMFTPAQVFPPEHMLTRLMRAICVLENFTLDDFDAGIARSVLNSKDKKESSERVNMQKAISKDSVTFNKFMELFTTVLGKDIDITIHLTDRKPNGDLAETRDYRASEVINTIVDMVNIKAEK